MKNKFNFEEWENFYPTYVGGSANFDYDFDLAIPAGTTDGSYRLRVISPWGSDGVTVGDNGYGGCGDYQYGNFEDFTINVVDVSSVGENAASNSIFAFPNPTNGPLTIEAGTGQPLERILVRSADGRLVQELAFTGMAAKGLGDLSALPDGVYLVQGVSSAATLTVRVLKG